MADVRLLDVSKRYGAVTAVAGVSLTVSRGELVAVLGPSGCGKTTLLRMIAGLVRATSGRVLLGEQDVTDVAPNRRDVGIVFQNYALFPHLTVAQNVAFGLQMRRIARADVGRRVAEALALVGLAGFAERWPQQLSGGEQQRVALARALVIKPTVLLLDEPLAALDKALRQRMQVELRALQQQVGITTLFVTHDQDEALTMADRIAVMSRGRIEQVDTPAAIYESPRSAFVLGFLGRANSFSATVVAASSDGVRVRSAGGLELLSAHPAGPSEGALVVGIRPERVKTPRERHGGAGQRLFRRSGDHGLPRRLRRAPPPAAGHRRRGRRPERGRPHVRWPSRIGRHDARPLPSRDGSPRLAVVDAAPPGWTAPGRSQGPPFTSP